MVVGFDLHQDVHIFLMVGVGTAVRVGEETTGMRANNHRGVVFIGRQNIIVVTLVGVFNHLEQGLVLLLAIQRPGGVKDFVAAMLGVRLSEHHQLYVGRVTAQNVVVLNQVIHFVVGQCQTQVLIGFDQRITATAQNIDGAQWRRFCVGEQVSSRGAVFQHHFDHTVMQHCRSRGTLSGTYALYIVSNTTLQTLYLVQATVMGDVGGLGRPR